MKTNLPSHCGNSPKAELIKKLTIAFAKYDLDEAMVFMDPMVTWTLVGEPVIQGVDRFKSELLKMKDNSVLELTIHHLLTHGKYASINGEMTMKDGQKFGFADFYEFTSAGSSRISHITSYVVALS